MVDAEIVARVENVTDAAWAAVGDARIATTTAYAIGMLASIHDNRPAKQAAIEYAAGGADAAAETVERAAETVERHVKLVTDLTTETADPLVYSNLIPACKEAADEARKAAARARKAAAEVRANADK